MNKTSNIFYVLRDREYGKFPNKLSLLNLPDPIDSRSDSQCGGIKKLLKELQNAISGAKWNDIESSVGDIMIKLLDNTNSNSFLVTPKKRFQREFFVGFGGIATLLKLFNKPFSEPDARDIPERKVNEKAEVWNEVLVIIRELTISLPSLSEKLINNNQIVYFFTLLVHPSLFDNAMNLLEEILAARIETFSIGTIPKLFDLLGKFTSRQLAHFCRVLSLVLFEPEDRQIMEGAHVLKSIELLTLRRNRMSKNSSGIVERNQSLIIEMPNMLSRLIQILRVINYGPNLADLISHNIVLQTPITNDILTFISNSIGINDWDHFSNLEAQVACSNKNSNRSSSTSSSRPLSDYSSSNKSGITTTGTESTVSSSRSSAAESSRSSSLRSHSSTLSSVRSDAESVGPRSIAGTVRVPVAFSSSAANVPNSTSDDADDDGDIMGELLSAFSPNQNNSGVEDSQVFELSNIISVMQVAQNLGIANLTPLGEALLMGQQSLENRRAARTAARHRATSRRVNTPGHSKKELQFHAMLLAPHQIELIFVLCTLLSGRRKINVQMKLAEMGMAEILKNMYSRMSWDSPPYNNLENPMEHIHGPGCECNPESAVRVQFLRLIHNFYDRDFLGNVNKLQILSADERDVIESAKSSSDIYEFYNSIHEDGLLTKIISTLSKEPVESVYRFWLSACIENFLRGCGIIGQLFVAKTGILQTLSQHIISTKPSVNNSLQTSFDLMGEIIKCNLPVLEILEKSLNDAEFRSLVQIIMNNLIDSNVFVRSLYLSLEVINYDKTVQSNTGGMNSFGFHFNSLSSSENIFLQQNGQTRLGYLTDSWVQFSPKPISSRAANMYKDLPSNKQTAEKVNSNSESKENSELKYLPSPNKSKDPKAIFDLDEIPYNNTSFDLGDSSLPSLPSIQKARVPSSLAAKHSNSLNFSSEIIQPNSPNSFGSGMIGALRDIGRVTSIMLNRTDITKIDINEDSISINDVDEHSGKNINNNESDDYQIESDIFFTPLEEPKYVKAKYSNDVNDIDKTLNNVSINEKNIKFDSFCALDDSNNNSTPSSVKKNYSGYFIQDSLFRLSIFLVQEKVNILFRLISIVTLGSINHENICCLNTSLLILLFEYKRGNLVNILQKIRDLADRELKSLQSNNNNSEETNETSSGKIIYCSECGTNAIDSNNNNFKKSNLASRIPYSKSSDRVNRMGSATFNKCQDCKNNNSKINTKFSSSLFSSKSYCNISSLASNNNNTEDEITKDNDDKQGSKLVMVNFRELLWYWQEYYLRRGRDRLSIEFSTHIPFENWINLVDLLCKDDGSPTSLLDSSIKLPLSPYQRPFIGSLSSRLLDNNTILFQPFNSNNN